MKPRNWKEMMEKVELAVNTLNQSLIAITTFYLTWYCFHVGFNELIVYHVFLTTLGYQFLMAEGILAMYNRNTYTLLAETKAQKTAIHWILQAIGGILAIAGVIIQIISRFRLGKAHFSLIHSIVGLISMIFLVLTFISGCSSLYSQHLKNYFRPIFTKFAHNILAIICFISGMSSIILGYITKSWAKRDDPGDIRYTMAWFLGLIIIFTMIGPLKTLWNHVGSIFRR